MSSHLLYTQLDESRCEIRLLRILSDRLDSAVECKWDIVSLQDKPKFTALFLLSVTKNLAAALRYARGHWQTAYPGRDPGEFRIWADALSINQDNLDERSSQVQLMRSIYSDAELMIAWLGSGLEGIDSALEKLTIIAEETEQQVNQVSIGWFSKYPSWFIKDDDAVRMWTAFWNFSELDYWRRIWIFQELLLGTNILFAHGTTNAPHRKLFQASDWLRRMIKANDAGLLRVPEIYTDLFTLTGWFQLDRIAEARKRMQPLRVLPTSDIEYLYQRFGDLVATDPRDHVYALLGFLETDIIPDYKLSVEEVLRSYIDLYVRTTKSLVFLHSAGFGRFDSVPNDSLPSWVPDFAKCSEYARSSRGSQFGAALISFDHGRADKNLFNDCPDLPQKHGTRLQSAALFVARIQTMHHSLPEMSYLDGTLYKFVCDMVKCYKLEHSNSTRSDSNPSKVHHPLSQIFWALVSNLVTESEHGAIPHAIAFLMILLIHPRANGHCETDEDLLQVLELDLGLSTENGVPLAILNAFSFLDTPGNVEYVKKLVDEQGYLGHPHTMVLKGLWATQVLFRFASLSIGRLALVPQYSQAGDILAILKGCGVPIILREKGDDYFVVGICFMYGLMYGEAGLTDLSQRQDCFKVIDLV
ncbi:hypothetical protein BT63DRAFT_133873 [Microthyrium microscopicum]|uniref:Heterokaryon incompatibility domain-containing protein n=1 Tax=Microthyrium microscopicum TaxID=703497 RepID=A0A6A6UMN3_9PEZI|nr:hypothetical protein BT63DRAFT_133873 [Microthyrium microscopicum]